MRIIGGTLGGRRLHPPSNLPVRPTTDLAKESLFNILNNIVDFEALKVLDLFSGTGSISYEFASRNAVEVVSVDVSQRCTAFIKKTIEELHISNQLVYKTDVFNFLKSCRSTFDLIFADPPYDSPKFQQIPEMIFGQKLLNDSGMLIVEHPREINYASHPNFERLRNYGKVNFSFFINQ